VTNFTDVGDFHRRFDLPHLGDGSPPRLLSPDEFKFRYEFLKEELTELFEAHSCGDLPGFLDALVDLVYVACGTAHLSGLPFDAAWDEVQRANLTKVRATSANDPLSKRGHALDVVKPPGWVAPDIEGVLRRHEGRT
jgi:predicted HAD superfamily Cof-like phosphohydrolase